LDSLGERQALFYTEIEKKKHYKTPYANLEGTSGELVFWFLTSFLHHSIVIQVWHKMVH